MQHWYELVLMQVTVQLQASPGRHLLKCLPCTALCWAVANNGRRYSVLRMQSDQLRAVDPEGLAYGHPWVHCSRQVM